MGASSEKIVHHIDQPRSWERLSRCIIIRGWCFATDGNPLHGMRLRVGNLCLNGITGLPRPDVKAAVPNAPDDHSGFELRGVLPTGQSKIAIEAGLADGTWHLLLTQTVTVPRSILPLWLGGGGWTELMFFQMPAHMKYPPRLLNSEQFPGGARSPSSALKISVVTPSYQQARYLPKTLHSVLEQPHVNCEYVVQDGGSNDGSGEIIQSLATISALLPGSSAPAESVRLIAWESARDEGQADAIVRGFAKTSGGPDDLMAWINSDDFYLPGALAFVANYFEHHPEVEVVYGHRILVDENSQEIGRWFLPRHNEEVLRLNDFVPQETLFWRRRIWDRVGGLDRSFKFAMDWDLLLRFQTAGARIVRLPYFLACFRIHPVQKTSAAMHGTGQGEITLLRERTFGRAFPPQELEKNPVLLRYLRQSAWIEFLWQLGIRAR